MKKSIVLYLHVHQPWRVNDYYNLFEVGKNSKYFKKDLPNDSNTNGAIFKKVAEKSYLPMNNLLEKLLSRYPKFKFSLSITGTFIDQAEKFAPEVLESFKRLIKTGRVEIVAETYYHSLAFFFDHEEFETQVRAHMAKIQETFGVIPTAFRNTELAYNDELARWADEFGFKAILAEGWDSVLEWRTPNHVYRPPNTQNIRLLLKNYKLSDDLAFRFSNHSWEEYPLTTAKYIEWLNASSYHGEIINLFMDYETFGEHQWAESGIFIFFESFVGDWLKNNPDHDFETVSQAAEREPVAEISMPNTITWADTERDLTAWLGNSMQQEAMRLLYSLKSRIYNCGYGLLAEDWRRLQTSDHAYYMCTKFWNDGDVHTYFSSYKSPYDAFLCYMDALRDMDYRLRGVKIQADDSISSKEILVDPQKDSIEAKSANNNSSDAGSKSSSRKKQRKKATKSIPRPPFNYNNMKKNWDFVVKRGKNG